VSEAHIADKLLATGRQRRWDMVKSHSSVGIVLYHAELDALLVVRQFRPAVSFILGHTEACVGLSRCQELNRPVYWLWC